ncbi:MAG: DUF421 domain-containing protein [Clostridia bacterium]|nr:DUF421 domain-containing protein [Clostridia bacterium]
MIVILIRTIILYSFVLLIVRIMGKSELAELEPFQLVVTLMIAELAALPMEDTDVSLMNGITALVTLLLIQVLISYIALKSKRARMILCGKPSVIINKGKIDEKEMRKLRMNINDLLEQVRAKDYPSLEEIEYAILETNGDLSIIPKPENRPLTRKDINLTPTINHMSLPLIMDGYLYKDTLKTLNLTEDWLKNQLDHSCISEYSEVLFCYIDENGKLHIHRKDKGGNT